MNTHQIKIRQNKVKVMFALPLSILSVFSLTVLVMLLPHMAYAQNQTMTAKPLDLRILVDVSGSMKTTDPQNLRVPALQVLAQLLPDDAQVGVWEFAEGTAALMPYGLVNNQWRQQALSNDLTIRSDGRFTDIGGALRAVASSKSVDFTSASTTDRQRHIILLTDGVVDIDTNAAVNIRATNQLLRFTKADFVQNGARVHAIGLSNEVDQRTLSELSRKTNGLFAIANNADDLLDIFLRALDNSAATQQVTIDADTQTFTIKESAESITIVIEKNQPNSQSNNQDQTITQNIVLQSPTGERLSPDSDKVIWQSSKTHDVITINNPDAGDWQLVSDEAKLVRVNVDNQLKLTIDLDTNNVFVGETVALNLLVTDASGQVYPATALADGDITFTLYRENGSIQWQQSLATNDTTLVANSRLQINMPAVDIPGLYRLTIAFTNVQEQQQIERSIRVHPPIDYVITQQAIEEGVQYEVNISPLSEKINVDASAVTITGKQGPKDFSKQVPLTLDKWQDQWQIDTPLNDLSLVFKGNTYGNESIVYEVDNVTPQIITAKEVQQQAQAAKPAVGLLPAPDEIEVNQQVDEIELNTVGVTTEQASDAVKELIIALNEDEQPTTSTVQVEDNEVSTAVKVENEITQNKVTVDIETTESRVNTHAVLIGILILVIVLGWLLYRRKA